MRRFFDWAFRIVVLVLLGTGVGSAQNWYLSSQADIKSHVGFVGTFRDINRLDCPFPNKPFALPFNNQNAVVDGCDGVMYRLRYRVSEVLEGKLKIGDEVSFDVHNYEGTPELADYLNALILLGVAPDGYHYDGRMSMQVYPTSTGRFAVCGCQFDLGRAVSACPQVSFEPAQVVDLTYASVARIARFKDDKAYEIETDKAVCKRGQYARSFYRKWVDGNLIKIVIK